MDIADGCEKSSWSSIWGICESSAQFLKDGKARGLEAVVPAIVGWLLCGAQIRWWPCENDGKLQANGHLGRTVIAQGCHGRGYHIQYRSLALLQFLAQPTIVFEILSCCAHVHLLRNSLSILLSTICDHECMLAASFRPRILANNKQFTPVNPRPLLQSLYVPSLQ